MIVAKVLTVVFPFPDKCDKPGLLCDSHDCLLLTGHGNTSNLEQLRTVTTYKQKLSLQRVGQHLLFLTRQWFSMVPWLPGGPPGTRPKPVSAGSRTLLMRHPIQNVVNYKDSLIHV